MAYFSVEIRASEILEKMQEDATFAGEMWREIFDGLIAGQLLDDAADFCYELRASKQKVIADKLRVLADAIHAA